MPGCCLIPGAAKGKAAVLAAVGQWVEAAITADRKITALKTLQVRQGGAGTRGVGGGGGEGAT